MIPFLERAASSHSITVYKHGLPVECPLDWLGTPYVSGWVNGDGLRLDLSGQSVIRDERWHQLVKDLEAALGRVVEDLCWPVNRRQPHIHRLLMRCLLDRALDGQPPLRVRGPVQLANPPAGILLPQTPAMEQLLRAPLIELEDEPPMSARELAEQVLKGKEPVLANLSPGQRPDASRLSSTALPLLECWPSRPLEP